MLIAVGDEPFLPDHYLKDELCHSGIVAVRN